jgi:hypothetical protein
MLKKDLFEVWFEEIERFFCEKNAIRKNLSGKSRQDQDIEMG